MKFHKLTLIKIVVGICLFVLFPINCYAIVEPTSRFYVNDYADILTDEVEDYIFDNSVKLL